MQMSTYYGKGQMVLDSSVVTCHSELPHSPAQATLFTWISASGWKKISPTYRLEPMLPSVEDGTTFSIDKGSGIRGTDGAGNCGELSFPGMVEGEVKSTSKPRMVSLGLTVVIVIGDVMDGEGVGVEMVVKRRRTEVSSSGKPGPNGDQVPKFASFPESSTIRFSVGALDSWPCSEREDTPIWLDGPNLEGRPWSEVGDLDSKIFC
jgi:hypothetical protein